MGILLELKMVVVVVTVAVVILQSSYKKSLWCSKHHVQTAKQGGCSGLEKSKIWKAYNTLYLKVFVQMKLPVPSE